MHFVTILNDEEGINYFFHFFHRFFLLNVWSCCGHNIIMSEVCMYFFFCVKMKFFRSIHSEICSVCNIFDLSLHVGAINTRTMCRCTNRFSWVGYWLSNLVYVFYPHWILADEELLKFRDYSYDAYFFDCILAQVFWQLKDSIRGRAYSPILVYFLKKKERIIATKES